MPAAVVAVGLGLLVIGALAAVRAPAPCVSEETWRCAGALAVPVGLLLMVSLTVVARPSAFAVAMVSGAAFCAVAWVLRAPPAPRESEEDDDGGDDGPHEGGNGDPPPDGVDWAAFERDAYAAWRRQAGGRRATAR